MLIADDVADTGQTLVLVKEFLEGKVAEVRIAVLYEKPRSVVQCEYVWSAPTAGSSSPGAPTTRSRRRSPAGPGRVRPDSPGQRGFRHTFPGDSPSKSL